MTREEAARLLDPETTWYELWKHEEEMRLEDCNEACRMGADALRAQQKRENQKQITNADRIRDMSDEELAELLNQWGTSTRAWQKDKGETMYWLKQPAEEG